MKPVALAILLFTLILIGLMLFGAYETANAAEQYYNTVKVDCGTLHGVGNVSVWFNDELYHIPIECN